VTALATNVMNTGSEPQVPLAPLKTAYRTVPNQPRPKKTRRRCQHRPNGVVVVAPAVVAAPVVVAPAVVVAPPVVCGGGFRWHPGFRRCVVL
jgi:hypothetical protein